MGGFIRSEGPALKADIFVMTGGGTGKEDLHPSLAYPILMYFLVVLVS